MSEEPQVQREILWAPWREAYISRDSEPEGCVFCFDPAEDERRLVLWRSSEAFVLLNFFPYSNGHLLVLPVRHVADPTELTLQEWSEIHKGLTRGIKALRQAFEPQGFNLGMNLGSFAGAGVANHLHVHVVPRWNGDTNFMTVLGGTRVLCQDLVRTYEVLKAQFDAVGRD